MPRPARPQSCPRRFSRVQRYKRFWPGYPSIDCWLAQTNVRGHLFRKQSLPNLSMAYLATKRAECSPVCCFFIAFQTTECRHLQYDSWRLSRVSVGSRLLRTWFLWLQCGTKFIPTLGKSERTSYAMGTGKVCLPLDRRRPASLTHRNPLGTPFRNFDLRIAERSSCRKN